MTEPSPIADYGARYWKAVNLDVEIVQEWYDRLLLADPDDENVDFVLSELRQCLPHNGSIETP